MCSCPARSSTPPRLVLRVGGAARPPPLRGRPVIVGVGVVLAASYEAKACGVHTPMGGRRPPALPHAVVVPPRFDAYSEASKAVFEVFEDTTPLVEGISIDEAFLDVGGSGGSPARREIAASCDGGARRGRAGHHRGHRGTKFLAKVASGVGKARRAARGAAGPRARVPAPAAGRAPLGRGPVTAAKLHGRGIQGREVRSSPRGAGGDARRAPGRHLHALAHGATHGRASAAGGGGRSARSARWAGAAHGGARCRARGARDRVTGADAEGQAGGRTVVLRLRFDDFSRATRSHTLGDADGQDLDRPRRSSDASRGGRAAHRAPRDNARRHRRHQPRSRGPGPAPSMPGPGVLDSTLDELRERYGTEVITRAVLLDRDENPRSPDETPRLDGFSAFP